MKTSPLMFVSQDSRYTVVLEHAAIISMLRSALSAGSDETGGVIAGRYEKTHSLARVLTATPPPKDSKHGPFTFERGVAGLTQLFKNLWANKEREYYLGEWHFHPFANTVASSTDVGSLKRHAIDPSYDCSTPILLILGGDPNGDWQIAAYLSREGRDFVKLAALSSDF